VFSKLQQMMRKLQQTTANYSKLQQTTANYSKLQQITANDYQMTANDTKLQGKNPQNRVFSLINRTLNQKSMKFLCNP